MIAFFARHLIWERTGAWPSRTLTQMSVALGGYGPWLLATSPGGHVVLSLLAIPAILRVLAFDRAGQPRRVPRCFELSLGPFTAVLVACAVVLIVPFALQHPFTANGYSPQAADGKIVHPTKPGRWLTASAGLTGGRFAVAVTGVRLLGPSGGLRVAPGVLSVGGPTFPFARRAPLPFHVPAGRSLWVSYRLKIRRCEGRPVGVTRIRLSYRELGLSLTQTVRLADGSMLLTCG